MTHNFYVNLEGKKFVQSSPKFGGGKQIATSIALRFGIFQGLRTGKPPAFESNFEVKGQRIRQRRQRNQVSITLARQRFEADHALPVNPDNIDQSHAWAHWQLCWIRPDVVVWKLAAGLQLVVRHLMVGDVLHHVHIPPFILAQLHMQLMSLPS